MFGRWSYKSPGSPGPACHTLPRPGNTGNNTGAAYNLFRRTDCLRVLLEQSFGFFCSLINSKIVFPYAIALIGQVFTAIVFLFEVTGCDTNGRRQSSSYCVRPAFFLPESFEENCI